MMFAEPDKTSCVIRKDPVTLTPLIHVRKPMIVTFHEIVDSSSSDIYKLSLEQFEAYLQVIQELREEPEANNSTIQVTFDDGHISHYQLAIPLLEQYRIRAVFFVTVGLIGVSTQYMCWSQLKELVASGHEVQSHTWSHPFLTDCSPSLLQEELRRSRETLEQRLALPVRAISIPYGRYTGRVLQACASAGYERVYTSDPWIGSQSRAGVRVYGRLSVRSTLEPIELRRFLTLEALPYLYLRTKSRGKEVVKLLLGDNFYRRVWLRKVRNVLGMLLAIRVLSETFLWQNLYPFLGS